MARLYFNQRTRANWEPADYTANETATVINVGAGDLWEGVCQVRVREVFNGGATKAIIIVGDGDDPNGGMEDGQVDEITVGLNIGGGAYYNTKPKLYLTDDTIDIGFTASTSGTRTTGIIDLAVWIAKTDPH